MSDKIKSLSDAILIGSAGTMKCSGRLVLRNGRDEIYAACAIGAALLAIGYYNEGRMEEIDEACVTQGKKDFLCKRFFEGNAGRFQTV